MSGWKRYALADRFVHALKVERDGWTWTLKLIDRGDAWVVRAWHEGVRRLDTTTSRELPLRVAKAWAAARLDEVSR